MVRVRQLLNNAEQLLSGSDTAQFDSEVLLCHVLGKDRAWLRTWPEETVSTSHAEQFNTLLESRQKGTPVAYLLGSQGFWSLDLKVTSDTLIPRPETELMIEIALNLPLPNNSHVVDLGTGTGAIALALASERSDWQVMALDSQPEALKVAAENTQRSGLTHVQIIQSHWFDQLAQEKQFNLIVSNPPYIDHNDPHLQQGDIRFEPKTALIADADGLSDLQHIISRSGSYLSHQGWLLVEHGYDQGKAVRDLFIEAGFGDVVTRKDYNGLERVTLGQWLQ